jgi:protein involved in polysaccharide export with SLBB domain
VAFPVETKLPQVAEAEEARTRQVVNNSGTITAPFIGNLLLIGA